ncbi:hypothetical protein CDV25_06460 [Helicobacter apodemus]|uniref:Uncharacterized protein n=1 Tax=Helicobacter apodemus TaxID=135569 RepID=A0A2U8FDY9_9HELI|nr:hypothetical protein CDV25_06460 [Helicobacter apodemus]
MLQNLFSYLAKLQTIKRFQKKEKQLYEENKDIIPLMYSKTILFCGRTLIIKAINAYGSFLRKQKRGIPKIGYQNILIMLQSFF